MKEGGTGYDWSREKDFETQQLGIVKVSWKKEDLIGMSRN